MRNFIDEIIKGSINASSCLYEQTELLYIASNIIEERFKQGYKLFTFGNGGSAADAQHIAAEFVGKFKREKIRKGLPAIALTTDSSFLTAWSNDCDFSTVFERQVETYAKPRDILWGISTSGNSENVIKALEKGREIGTYNLSFTGRDGGRIKEISDININIPVYETARIQEAHLLAYHIICELVENKLISENDTIKPYKPL